MNFAATRNDMIRHLRAQREYPFKWRIHRNGKGSPRWWQRFYEAWLVITGKYTFWHAWQDGKHAGAMSEYSRMLRGGDFEAVMWSYEDLGILRRDGNTYKRRAVLSGVGT